MDYDEQMAELRRQLKEWNQARAARSHRRPAGGVLAAYNEEVRRLREAEMRRLRTEEGWSYQQIGDHFGGLSRQRVQQVLGSTGRPMAGQTRNLILAAPYEETNEEIAARLGLKVGTVSTYRRDTPHRIGGKPGGRSQRIQRVVDEIAVILRGRGLDVRPLAPRAAADLVVGDHRLGLCICFAGRIPPSQRDRLVNPRHSFAVHKSKDSDDPLDFYLLIIGECQAVFVVPYAVVPAGADHIHFCWPSQRPQLGRYQPYWDRFDLLEE